jgi:hypothetical protein
MIRDFLGLTNEKLFGRLKNLNSIYEWIDVGESVRNLQRLTSRKMPQGKLKDSVI